MALPPGFILSELPVYPEQEWRAALDVVFGAYSTVDRRELLGKGERYDERRERMRSRQELRVAVHLEGELVAWSYCVQDHVDRLYMASSGVLPEHREMGIYSHMLFHVEHRAREEGYRRIHSNHIATNNPILIAKLKAGFFIDGMQLSAEHGVLVHMTKPLTAEFSELLRVRAGERRAPTSLNEKLMEPSG